MNCLFLSRAMERSGRAIKIVPVLEDGETPLMKTMIFMKVMKIFQLKLARFSLSG